MTAFALKIIISFCMLIDHVGAVFAATMPRFFRWIGRIAFPIYAYMIAQGCKHTKNINKYLLRLGIFALISEIPFDMAFMRQQIDFLENTNVFYTLFFGVACIAIYEKLKCRKRSWLCLIALPLIPTLVVLAFVFQKDVDVRAMLTVGFTAYFLIVLFMCQRLQLIGANAEPALPKKAIALISALPIVFFGSLLSTDYGMWGAIYILLFYLMKPESKTARTVTMAIVVFHEYLYQYIQAIFVNAGIYLPHFPGRGANFSRDALEMSIVAFIAVLLVFLYSGKQGRKAKWAFYAFYPLHIAVLAVI